MPGDPWLSSVGVQANATARLSDRSVMEAVAIGPATVWGFHLSVFVEFSLGPSSFSREVSPLNSCLVGPSLTASIFEGLET